MRLERLTNNKIKIFLSSDDLYDRGLTKEDIWKDSLKWHQLFHDMLLEASEEFDIEIMGSVAVEIFSLHAQGMVMIVTMSEEGEEDQLLDDGIIEMKVTVDNNENDEVLFEFINIDHVIDVSKRLMQANIYGGSLLFLDDRYYFLMKAIPSEDLEKTVALLAEYGMPSIMSVHRIIEYGKVIIQSGAVELLVRHFFAKEE